MAQLNLNFFRKFIDILYLKLVKINDSPQRIALGLGLGVFCGILPVTGPIASLFLAFIFRVNRVSALIGSLFTNTWLSFVTFLLAIKVGSVILGTKWQIVYQDWDYFLRRFNWPDLLNKLSVLKVILPVIVGYLVVGFCLGLLVYLVTLLIIIKRRHQPRPS